VPLTGRPTVEFFYCFSCPWTYLAFIRLNEAALRTGAVIEYRPVLATWIHQDANHPDPHAQANPAAAAYASKDLEDWARFCGVEIALPQPWPVRPEWAQRGAMAAIEAGLIRSYAEAIFRAHFAAGWNIATREVVLDIAAGCGLAGASFEARLVADDVLAAIRRNSDELVKRGGFGSPTMFLRDDMYFGHDRVPLLESALMRAADRPFIAPGDHSR